MAKKELLLATDMTTDVEFALDYGIRMASYLDADVCILHVYMPQVMSMDGMIVSSPESIDLRKEAFETYVQDIAARHADLNVNINHKFEVGFPVKKIIEISNEMSAFAIVMATSRPTIMKQWLGSVSMEVMQHASIPVLLVPPKSTFQGLKRIGYADDFSSNHDIGLPYLNILLAEFLSDVHLIHIGIDIEPKSNWLNVESMEKEFHGVDIKRVLLSDDKVAPALARYANEHNIQLVVVPSPRHGMIYQLFHKSVSKNLSMQIDVPLLVIH